MTEQTKAEGTERPRKETHLKAHVVLAFLPAGAFQCPSVQCAQITGC